MKAIAQLAIEAKRKGYNFIGLTSSSPDSFEEFKNETGAQFDFFNTDEITLKTGDASITMKKDGTIQIKGKDITIIGSGKISAKASGDMVLKGSKIAEN